HRWGQLIYAGSGVMRVRAGRTLWIVPPARAIWAPAGSSHEIWARGEFAMRTLYLDPRISETLPDACVGLDIPPLLRELILHAVDLGLLHEDDPVHARLSGVIVDQLAGAKALPLALPLPADPRAARLAERLREDPATELELGALAADAGASPRTIQRLFLAETGLRFAEWRQRLRLLHGASLLGAGASVTEAGLEAGYASTSAFTAAFRKQFGRTPTGLR
ncbi:MAG: helix-turn-helix transcriptional regulator, partial [Caulobacteraceae bacterium]